MNFLANLITSIANFNSLTPRTPRDSSSSKVIWTSTAMSISWRLNKSSRWLLPVRLSSELTLGLSSGWLTGELRLKWRFGGACLAIASVRWEDRVSFFGVAESPWIAVPWAQGEKTDLMRIKSCEKCFGAHEPIKRRAWPAAWCWTLWWLGRRPRELQFCDLHGVGVGGDGILSKLNARVVSGVIGVSGDLGSIYN